MGGNLAKEEARELVERHLFRVRGTNYGSNG